MKTQRQQEPERHRLDLKILKCLNLWKIISSQGQKNKSKKGKKGQTEQKPSDSSKTLDFFKSVDKEKIRQLYEHYKYDFEIFGYSAEEYF